MRELFSYSLTDKEDQSLKLELIPDESDSDSDVDISNQDTGKRIKSKGIKENKVKTILRKSHRLLS